MKKTISLLLMSMMGMVGTYAFAGSDREDTIDRMQRSVEVLQSIMVAPDKGIPEDVLNGARCIVVVPNLIKGGFIIGGKNPTGRLVPRRHQSSFRIAPRPRFLVKSELLLFPNRSR